MFCVAVALSPSLSVIVAVSVTRLSADSVVGSFGSLVGVHHRADAGPASRCRRRPPSTVNTRSSLVAVRPSTRRAVQRPGSPPAPVAVSTRPDAPAIDAQRIGDRAGAVGAERRGERARKARRRVRSPDRSRRPSASALARRRADARPVVQEHKVLADVQRRRRAVAVLVRDRRRQRHQIVRRQRLRLVRIVGRDAPPRGSGRASHCRTPSTVTVNTSVVAGRRAAFNDRAVQRPGSPPRRSPCRPGPTDPQRRPAHR